MRENYEEPRTCSEKYDDFHMFPDEMAGDYLVSK